MQDAAQRQPPQSLPPAAGGLEQQRAGLQQARHQEVGCMGQEERVVWSGARACVCLSGSGCQDKAGGQAGEAQARSTGQPVRRHRGELGRTQEARSQQGSTPHQPTTLPPRTPRSWPPAAGAGTRAACPCAQPIAAGLRSSGQPAGRGGAVRAAGRPGDSGKARGGSGAEYQPRQGSGSPHSAAAARIQRRQRAGRHPPLMSFLATAGGSRCTACASNPARVACTARSTHALYPPRWQATTISSTFSGGTFGSRPCWQEQEGGGWRRQQARVGGC